MAELEIKPALTTRFRVFGLFAAALVLTLTLMYLLAGGGQDILAARSTLVTYMADADGLSAADDVRLSGFQIGEVQSVDLTGSLSPNREVAVRMNVLDRYLKMIPQDSITAVGADTMVGDKFIEISPGKSFVPVVPDAILPTRPAAQTTDRADVLKALRNDLDQVDQLLVKMMSPDTDLGKFITGQQEYETAVGRIEGFDQGIHTVLVPQSNLGKAFYSLEMYNRIQKLVLTLDKQLSDIQNGEGTIGHLVATDDQYNTILRSIKSLRMSLADTRAGNGQLGALLAGDASWQRIVKILSEIEAAMAGLNSGEGKAGRLLANAQFYESLNGSLRKLDNLLRDIHQSPEKYTHLRR